MLCVMCYAVRLRGDGPSEDACQCSRDTGVWWTSAAVAAAADSDVSRCRVADDASVQLDETGDDVTTSRNCFWHYLGTQSMPATLLSILCTTDLGLERNPNRNPKLYIRSKLALFLVGFHSNSTFPYDSENDWQKGRRVVPRSWVTYESIDVWMENIWKTILIEFRVSNFVTCMISWW